MTNDLISRQAAIDALKVAYFDEKIQSGKDDPCVIDAMTDWSIRQIKALPSAQPEITLESAIDYLHSIGWMQEHDRILTESARPEVILCNSCKHWTQSTGKMTGYGLGRCDFHDADLVTCNGFCYWAERRTDD